MLQLKARFLLTVMAVTFASSAAWGQNNISLNGTTSGSVNFTGAGSGNLTLALGSCNGGTNCIDGSASGNGVFGGGSPPLNGFFEISGASVLALTNTSPTNWNVTGGTFSFIFSSLADGGGLDFLNGTLDLIDLGQSGSSGTFNTNFVANLTGLGGSLASLFTSAGGIANISLSLNTSSNLSGLALGAPASGTIGHASITTTPEPGMMMLFGSGLLMLGGFLRRQLRPRDA
jgi:hypothetical protein